MKPNRPRLYAAFGILFLLGLACLAATQPFVLQLLNGSSILGTWTNYGQLKCSTGMTCSLSGSTFTMTSSGGGFSPTGTGIATVSSGSAGTTLTSPTTNCVYNVVFNVTGSAAVAPTAACPGFATVSISGSTSTFTVLYSNNLSEIDHDYQASANVAVTLPTPTTLNNSAFGNRWCEFSTHTMTLTPTTWTINGSASFTTAAGAGTEANPVCYLLRIDPTNATNWLFSSIGSPASVTVDTSTTVTVSNAPAEYHFNENATAATAVTYTLPTSSAGIQKCFTNAYNGSAANTGTLTIQTSASGQFIIYTDGTLSATGGYVISGGAAHDAACVVGVDSTHWQLYVQSGTWTKH